MRNRIEVLAQIRIHNISKAGTEQFMDLPHRVLGTSLRAVPVSVGLQIRFKDQRDYQLGGGLHYAVPNRRDAERPLAASGLRYHYPSHRLRPIRLLDQLFPYIRQPASPPCRFDCVKTLVVHPGRTSVGFRQRVGMLENVLRQILSYRT